MPRASKPGEATSSSDDLPKPIAIPPDQLEQIAAGAVAAASAAVDGGTRLSGRTQLAE